MEQSDVCANGTEVYMWSRGLYDGHVRFSKVKVLSDRKLTICLMFNVYNFEKRLFSYLHKYIEIIQIKHLQPKKRQYLPFCQIKVSDFKDTIKTRA